MKTYIYAGIGLVFLMLCATIIGQYRIIKQEQTKQVAIQNPAEKKAEVVERVITRTVTKEGKPVEVIREITKTITEKIPVVPNSIYRQPAFYISGTLGNSLGRLDAIWDSSYGVGVGWNISSSLSTGIRYDTIGQEQRVALEVRVNF